MAAVAGIGLSACGGDGNEASQTAPRLTAPDLNPPPTAAPTTAQPGLSSPTGTWTIGATNEDGYSAEAIVRVGTITADQAALARVQSLCGLDPATAAVVPAEVEIRNTTGGFTEGIGLDLSLAYPRNAVRTLLVSTVAQFSDGPSCAPSDNSARVLAIRWADVAPGESRTTSLDIVIRDYFTPAYPTGDTEGYQALALGPTVLINDVNAGRPTVAGPGVGIATHLGYDAFLLSAGTG